MRRFFQVPSVLTASLTIAALVWGPPQAAAGPPADLVLEPVVSGLTEPLAVRHAGDGSGRLFLVEQAGRILIWDGDQLLATPFLDIQAEVENGGNEQGLLGLAFHPDFASNGYFYVNYTYDTGEGVDRTRVARYSVSAGDPNVADPTETVILEVEQDFANHNGGDMHFGPDGYLYIALGDGGSGGDPLNRAQDPSTLLGSLLRIDVDSTGTADCGLIGNYGVPATNPFVGVAGACDEIWSYGLRNPWRFSFDRVTGDLFIADVGQNTVEEIDLQSAASAGGENYGWSCMEGDLVYNSTRCDGSPLIAPVLSYQHDIGCSVTGGFSYRGHRVSGMQGTYAYGDYCTGRIWFADASQGSWTSTLWADTTVSITSFGEGEDGALYLVDRGGEIYRFVSPSTIFLDDFELGDTSAWLAN